MSRESVVQLITRALGDEKFVAEIKANPDAVLAQYDLTAEETAAIKSGNAAKLQEMGIDERVSKLSTPTVLPQALMPTTVAPSSLSPESLIPWVLSLFSTTPTQYTP